jgi:hypothetical protein
MEHFVAQRPQLDMWTAKTARDRVQDVKFFLSSAADQMAANNYVVVSDQDVTDLRAAIKALTDLDNSLRKARGR